MKKIISLFCLLIICFLLSGCGSEDATKPDVTGTTTVVKEIVSEDFNRNGTGKLKCSQEAVAEDGIDVDLSYLITYKNGNILELVSIQKVISQSDSSLDLYESAYETISDNYNGLKYYDGVVVRDSNSVTYTITINYDKIDIKKLLEIEGEEDNIIKNGKAKLSLWLDLAGKMGTVCEEV